MSLQRVYVEILPLPVLNTVGIRFDRRKGMSAWVNQIFRAAIVSKGGMVRRKKSSVLKYSSFRELSRETKKRGFHLLRNGGQYIIICNKGQFRFFF
jgi:hypothetical protein